MDVKIDNLNKYKHIHLIGIGGVSMSAIAETLKNWNYTITGSDAAQSELTDSLVSHGIPVVIGHDLENSKKADLIIYSAAIKEEDPEMVIARENNIDTIGRGDFIGFLTKKYSESICVSGTHGKTTTTSMLSLVFLQAQKDPTIQVGAILKQIQGNYTIGNSEFFILEACEYMGNFLKFFPNTEIVLNIDNDHLDYFKNFENIKKAFQDYAKLLDENGLLVVNGDDKSCLELENYTKSKFITYGIENLNADYIAKNIEFSKEGFPIFDVYNKENFIGKIYLSVAGKHNILNALATISVSLHYNISFTDIAIALKDFTGANRRLEYNGSLNGAPVFDDYGHHPTEIKATYNAISNKTFNKSWVVFQPHTYSRTKNHLTDFAESLKDFDNIILLDIYAAREKNTFNISSKDLSNELLNKFGKESLYMPNFDEVVSYLKEHVESDDLVLTLGAGTVTEISKLLTK